VAFVAFTRRQPAAESGTCRPSGSKPWLRGPETIQWEFRRSFFRIPGEAKMSSDTSRNRYLLISLALSVILTWNRPAFAGPTVDHGLYDGLLKQFVHSGRVDYKGLQASEAQLDRYLEILAAVNPADLERLERFAFYINLYNAWTIKLILSAYPDLTSIKDLGNLLRSPWKKEIVRLRSGTVSLDHIEHEILRPQFRDPRVHFAINCAARSCPPLRSEAYIGRRLEEQLDDATRRFVNDPTRYRLEGNRLHVSRIFKWFSEDFDDDIIGFIGRFAQGEFKSRLQANTGRVQVIYLPYDWSLNVK
jgi:hypothetical protein